VILFKGKKRGMIHTMDITLDHVRAVFFPKNFYEKYHYLGSVPYNEGGDIFKAMEPLVIFMDYKARPWWCPRFVLRFLHLFGEDNSIIRVRNKYLSDLKCRLTNYILLWDYKTKWTSYDLRISISATDQIWDLAHAIETKFYEDGYREDLTSQIKELDPNTKFHKGHTAKMLKEELDRLEKDSENIKDFICD
jgi:hypothetical protein